MVESPAGSQGLPVGVEGCKTGRSGRGRGGGEDLWDHWECAQVGREVAVSVRLAATLLWMRLGDWAGRSRRRDDYLQSPTCFPGKSGHLELELGQSSEWGEGH